MDQENDKNLPPFKNGVFEEPIPRHDKVLLSAIISNLEYSAFNLCEKSESDIDPGVIESTCPETTLFLAIRKLKNLAR